jgi:small conductance mechanosensitive channel
MALGILGAPPATLVTILGAFGLAFSLAVQDILKNFFSGIYLLLERPFRVGDTIKVKDQQGLVEHIGVRTTTLRTAENVRVLVPNAIVFAEVVSNQTYAQPLAEPDESSGQREPDAVAASERGHTSGPR